MIKIGSKKNGTRRIRLRCRLKAKAGKSVELCSS